MFTGTLGHYVRHYFEHEGIQRHPNVNSYLMLSDVGSLHSLEVKTHNEQYSMSFYMSSILWHNPSPSGRGYECPSLASFIKVIYSDEEWRHS